MSKARGRDQILAGSIIRSLMHIANPGEGVITRLFVGAGLQIDSSTGGEDQTGDVTISAIPVEIDADIPFIAGFRMETTSVTAGTVGAGQCEDSTDTERIKFTGTETFDITVSGVGGLDTGSETANTWYAVHVIADTNEVNASKVLLSLSSTAPTLPSGYDIFRRIGWLRNNASSDLYQKKQESSGSSRIIRYQEDLSTTLEVLTGGGATVFTDIDLSEFVPPTSVIALIYGATISKDFTVRPDGSTIEFMVVKEGGALVFGIDSPGQIIEYKGASPAGSFNVSALGYFDDLVV